MPDLTIASIVANMLAIMLAGAFVWAAVAKLRHPSSTVSAFRSLRLPQPSALSRGVPAIEATVAIVLFFLPKLGGALIVALVGAFTVVLLRARQWGPVRCGCFGAADTRPVTWVTYVRNSAIASAALFVVIISPPSIVSTFSTSVVDGIAAITSAATIALIAAISLAILDVRHRLGTIFGHSHQHSVQDHQR
jgi:Methylamine utilisation protein MauE